MPDDALRHLAHTLTQLRREAIPGGKRTAEQGEERNLRAVPEELSRQLESDGAARAVAGNDIGSFWPDRSDLRCEIGGHLLDTPQRLAVAVETRGLEAENRLIGAQVLREGAEAEHVAVVPRHRENGRAGSARLQRHDGALLLGERHGRAQKLQNFVLELPQFMAQFGRQHPGRGIATQPITVRPNVDIALAEQLKKVQHLHTSTSSRSPATRAGVRAAADHDKASMVSASPAIVGRSKRFRKGTSTPNRSRSWLTSCMASRECPPDSKKLSRLPTR